MKLINASWTEVKRQLLEGLPARPRSVAPMIKLEYDGIVVSGVSHADACNQIVPLMRVCRGEDLQQHLAANISSELGHWVSVNKCAKL